MDELPPPVAQYLQPRPVPREGHVAAVRRPHPTSLGLQFPDEFSLQPRLLLPQARQSLQPPLDPESRVEVECQILLLSY